MKIDVTVTDANNIICEVTPPAQQIITIDRGVAGPAATVAVGTTTTLAPGSAATVTNVGNSSAAVFNFGIPQGATGTGVAGGANTQVQFNNSGVLAGSANLTFDGTNLTLNGGTANGVAYLNGSKVLTTGSALTFDGTNLGVGTTNPILNFVVSNNNAAGFELDPSGVDSGPYFQGYNRSTSAFLPITSISSYFAFRVGTTPTEQMRLTSTGLGIGTSSPGEKLTVGAGGKLRMNRPDDATATLQYMGAGATGGYVFDNLNGDGFRWLFTGTEAMRIDSAGNVGIGTSSPGARLHVFQDSGSTSVMSGAYIQNLSFTNNSQAGIGLFSADNFNAKIYTLRSGSSEGNLVFATNGGAGTGEANVAERMRITSAGNVGIGTSSPAAKLDVLSAGYPALKIASSLVLSGNTYTGLQLGATAAFQSATIGWVYNSTAPTSSFFHVTPYGDTEGNVFQINSAGNLGLGVTPSVWSAYSAFQIGAGSSLAGNSSFAILSQNWRYDGNDRYIATAAASQYYQGNGAHVWRTAPSGTAGAVATFTQAMTLDASGNLLVGSTSVPSPVGSYKSFVVGGSTGGIVDIGTTTTSYGRVSADSVGLNVESLGATTTIFRTNSTERMRIDSAGNVGIGTTSASNRLYVKATATFTVATYIEHTAASPFGLQINYSGAAPNNTDNEFIYCSDTSNNRFIVYASGNVANRNNSYGGISDVKLKENIVDATPKLADLMQVRVRKYNLKGETQKQIGVVAQELEQVFPGMVEEAVDKDKDGKPLGTTTKQVKYSVFVPMLIKAMQEQTALIASLTARLDAANL